MRWELWGQEDAGWCLVVSPTSHLYLTQQMLPSISSPGSVRLVPLCHMWSTLPFVSVLQRIITHHHHTELFVTPVSPSVTPLTISSQVPSALPPSLPPSQDTLLTSIVLQREAGMTWPGWQPLLLSLDPPPRPFCQILKGAPAGIKAGNFIVINAVVRTSQD